MTELGRLQERLRQAQAARRQTIADTRRQASSRQDSGASAIAPGTRVFDLVSGEEGHVVFYTRENILISTPDRGNG